MFETFSVLVLLVFSTLSSFSIHPNKCRDLFKIITLHLDCWLQMSAMTRWAFISHWNLPQERLTIYFSIISHHKKKNKTATTEPRPTVFQGTRGKHSVPKCLSDRMKYYGIVTYYGSGVMTRDTRQSWRIQILYTQLTECWECQGRCIPEQCTTGDFMPFETRARE